MIQPEKTAYLCECNDRTGH